jgi:two-component system response regulator
METLSAFPPLTILVVDDNPLDVYLIRWVLDAHELSYDLQVIDNGDTAAEVFAQLAQQQPQRLPTLILLDLALPQRDGKALLRQIKAIPQGAAIRVLIVTGSTNPQDRADTLALGADAFFVKPFHLTPFMQLGDLIKRVAYGHAPTDARPGTPEQPPSVERGGIDLGHVR